MRKASSHEKTAIRTFDKINEIEIAFKTGISSDFNRTFENRKCVGWKWD